MSVLVTHCPCCGKPGRLEVFAPTGHALVVHPDRVDPDGVHWADEGCVLSTDEGMALLGRDRAPAPPAGT